VFQKSNRTKLSDDDPMPFGTYKGQRLGSVPDHWFRWFLKQEWAERWPDLLAYARLVEDSDE